MRIPLYQVDAFADRPFTGNPAAVCVLVDWLPDETLQQIAAENNLSETAFLVAEGEGHRLRWFTPVAEVPLCGHGTLAAAHVLFVRAADTTRNDEVVFETLSGRVTVKRTGGGADSLLVLDFPSRRTEPCEIPPALALLLGAGAVEVHANETTYMAVLADEAAVRDLSPDPAAILRLDKPYLIVTAPGDDCDFVSRFFAPAVGVPEDPVTGSAHCALVPYWSARLGRDALHARQVSRRGGELWCEARGERVRIGGRAVLVLDGEFLL